jgi:5S rRNA maturation endonuclease (ribonuclease M5)
MIKDLEDWKNKLETTNKIIIVEGKKDKEALTSLGIMNIITLKNKPMYKVIEETAEKTKSVIILTDLDKEGKKLYSILKKGLQKHGIKVDRQFREFLIKKTQLSCIEGIEKLFL